MKLASIWYPISRWDEAKRFYSELLGLKLNSWDDEKGWAFFETDGGPPFFLVRRPDLAGKGTGGVVDFLCDDLMALRARLVGAGARVETDLQNGESVKVLTFYDPDGNMVEASQIDR
ncbi:MAG TPA: VOC family protein [Symbiobacteriaceae bacterium]|jgi:predicted enzyme related to lactoylglutathione lyase|nr:VOC family protein [Symbiobacteriaceae bacterium]